MPVPILEILYQSEINIQFVDLENDNAELTENQVDSTVSINCNPLSRHFWSNLTLIDNFRPATNFPSEQN